MNICILHKSKINTSDLRKVFLDSKYKVKEVSLQDLDVTILQDMCSDIIIFDTLFQKGDTGDVFLIKEIQKITKTIPLLLVTNSNEMSLYRESMLDAGVDGCIQLPFLEEELRLRVDKLVKKKDSLLFNGTDISASDITVDIRSHVVEKSGKEISLTKTEYSILRHLFLRKNNIVSNNDLTSCLSENTKGDSLALDIHIFNIRKKICNENLITTVPLYGFTISDRMMLI